jgi:hypothetical protein
MTGLFQGFRIWRSRRPTILLFEITVVLYAHSCLSLVIGPFHQKIVRVSKSCVVIGHRATKHYPSTPVQTLDRAHLLNRKHGAKDIRTYREQRINDMPIDEEPEYRMTRLERITGCIVTREGD